MSRNLASCSFASSGAHPNEQPCAVPGTRAQAEDGLVPVTKLPEWVPPEVERYLTHTEAGLPIREMARQAGCHASTILRQIRRIETRRDDPLVDQALDSLRFLFVPTCGDHACKESETMGTHVANESLLTDADLLTQEALRVLRRLCESGAVLAVAKGMETAVVAREDSSGQTTKTCSVEARFVEAMALNGWIDCARPGRISRYKITAAGRAKLEQLLSEIGLSPGEAPLADQHRSYAEKTVQEGTRRRRIRYNACESPVTSLARRKDKEGNAFLSEALVSAAERLREDFELAQMGPRVAQNWDKFLTAGDRGGFQAGAGPASGPSAARARVADALRYLGPGLGDVALRCCCYLEGLESAEKRMGWSARSGKIVLRIALQRLSQFYTREVGDVLIG